MDPPTRTRAARPGPGAGGAPDAQPLRGIGIMLAAMFLVPFLDLIAKYLGMRYPVLEVVWARYFFHLVLIAPVVGLRYGWHALRPARPWLQALRGVLLLSSTILFFAAIARMPLTDALALAFISPLVITMLSPWLLGEKVGVRRWSAVLVGFLGALVVLRPGAGVFQWSSLLAMGGGGAYALYVIATRKLSGSGPPLVTVAWTAVIGALVLSITLPSVWVPPSALDWALMCLMGGIAAGGHFLIVRAYDFAPAALLAPLAYTELVVATAGGYLLFGDFPDAWVWSGIGIIVASGVYIAVREQRLRGR